MPPPLRPKVVIAKRRVTRVLADAAELRQSLEAAGMEASVVDFGAISFAEQVVVRALELRNVRVLGR